MKRQRPTSVLATAADGAELTLPVLPAGPMGVLGRLAEAGHEAALVGGSLRDVLRGGVPGDWDVATAARPEVVARLFPGSTWENRFGTVTVRTEQPVEVTTYRTEGGYRDRRRPDEVAFGTSLTGDLARRDFTINAIAWLPTDLARRRGRLVDPFDGVGDLRRGVLRAVGDPVQRFDEDALRLLRAARFAATLEAAIEPATEGAVRRLAPTAASVSGERAREELIRMLRHPQAPPSRGISLMEELGLLAVVLPELAALRGVPQAKVRQGDALDHSLRTADALSADRLTLRMTGLLHDLGKATTLAEGHFYGHEEVGAELATALLRRLRFPSAEIERISRLVRHHMFAYTSAWTDAAVRRFILRVGPDVIDELFELRRADNAASGVEEPASGGLAELEERVERELTAPMAQGDLAIDGHDLQRELGLAPGPAIGQLLDRLMERVLDDPALNERASLLKIARRELPGLEVATQRQAGTGRKPSV